MMPALLLRAMSSLSSGPLSSLDVDRMLAACCTTRLKFKQTNRRRAQMAAHRS